MSKNTKTKRIETVIENLTVIAGSITAALGFFLIIGAVGNSDLEVGTFEGNTKLMIIGAVAMAVGLLFAKAYYFQRQPDENPSQNLVGHIAWSDKELSFILMIEYLSDTEWLYVTCNPSGFLTSSRIVRTYENVDNYTWETV